jgi:hypothetical protein
MVVGFTDGSSTEYNLVSINEFVDMVTAPSLGAYFNRYVRRR